MSGDTVNLKSKTAYQTGHGSSTSLRPLNLATRPVSGIEGSDPVFLPQPGTEKHLKALIEQQLKLMEEDGCLQWHWKWVWRRPAGSRAGYWTWEWVFEELKIPSVFRPQR
jgi:hypothetical protein